MNIAYAIRDMPDFVQAQVEQAFRTTLFTVPARTGTTNQRAITAGLWVPIAVDPPKNVMASGGEGIAHLWCQVDPTTQLITDRVVVKQVIPGRARYNMARNWNGGIYQQPMECYQANLIWQAMAPADRQHVVSCLGWGGIDPQLCRYKLYYEYCDYGSMLGLMNLQKPTRKKSGQKRKGKKQLPEPFIWYMFESLAKACVAMDGAYNPDGMIHGDLHPDNVFFGAPNPNSFALYPVPKIADFGSARRLTQQVKLRQGGNNLDARLLESAAPEMSWKIPGHGPPHGNWEVPQGAIQWSQTSNIYQVGLIIACAMRSVDVLPENNWRRPPPRYNVPQDNQLHHYPQSPNGRTELRIEKLNPGPKKYSLRLVQLVWRCLRHDPNQRPTAAALLASINANKDYEGTDVMTSTTVVPEAMKKNKVVLKDERWAVGSNRP